MSKWRSHGDETRLCLDRVTRLWHRFRWWIAKLIASRLNTDFFFFFPRDEWCPSPGNGHICSPGVASGACCTCFHQKERWCNCFTGSEQLRQFYCSGLILFEVVSGPGSNGTGRTRVSNSAVLPHRQSQPNTVWIKPQPCPGRPHLIWEFWLDSLLFDAHRAEGSRRLIRTFDCLAAVRWDAFRACPNSHMAAVKWSSVNYNELVSIFLL